MDVSLREDAEEVKSCRHGRKVKDMKHHWHVGAVLVPMARCHVALNPQITHSTNSGVPLVCQVPDAGVWAWLTEGSTPSCRWGGVPLTVTPWHCKHGELCPLQREKHDHRSRNPMPHHLSK